MIPLSEAAARARISYNRLLRLVHLGEIRWEKTDGHWYVSRSEVDSIGFIQRGR